MVLGGGVIGRHQNSCVTIKDTTNLEQRRLRERFKSKVPVPFTTTGAEVPNRLL